MRSSNLLPADGEVYYWTQFLSKKREGALFRSLMETASWEQSPIVLFGKEILQPRLNLTFRKILSQTKE